MTDLTVEDHLRHYVERCYKIEEISNLMKAKYPDEAWSDKVRFLLDTVLQ